MMTNPPVLTAAEDGRRTAALLWLAMAVWNTLGLMTRAVSG